MANRGSEGREAAPTPAVSEARLGPGDGALMLRGPAVLLVAEGEVRAAAAGLRLALEAPELLCVPEGRGASVESGSGCRLLVARCDERLAPYARALPEEEALDALRSGFPATLRRGEAGPNELSALLEAAERAFGPRGESGAGARSLAFLASCELLLLLASLASRAREEGLGEASRRAAAPRSGSAGSPADGRPWSIDDALGYIDDRYADSFSLEFFVSRCALNTSDFSRRFKERTGYPLFEYLNRLRIRRACALLKDGDLPIIEVALAVGYNNASFFNRYFQRIMRTTPREYRAASRR